MLTKHDTGPVYFLVSSCYSCLASGICSFRVFVSQDLLTPYVLPLKCSCSSSWPDPHFRALPTPLLASASSLPLNTKRQWNPGLLACFLLSISLSLLRDRCLSSPHCAMTRGSACYGKCLVKCTWSSERPWTSESPLPLPKAGISVQVCTTTPSLCGARDESQGCTHTRQGLDQLCCIPSHPTPSPWN